MALRLSLEEVCYSYPLPGREDSPALTGVTMSVEPGEVFCIAGSNGSGKSTLAQVCAGLLAPSSGQLLYGGDAVRGRRGLLGFRRRVGVLFQSPEDQLFADTVEKDIAFGPRNRGLRGCELEDAVRRGADLAGLPLQEVGDRSPFSLSQGEKRRVALAGVLALDPEVLVLDEPFIGLDHDGRERLKRSLAVYAEKREASILMVSHDLGSAWPLADRFGLLSKGTLLGLDRKTDLLSSDTDLAALGMQLPQWGDLSRRLSMAGVQVADPADLPALARYIAAQVEARDGW